MKAPISIGPKNVATPSDGAVAAGLIGPKNLIGPKKMPDPASPKAYRI
jgi:hypothetical protein